MDQNLRNSVERARFQMFVHHEAQAVKFYEGLQTFSIVPLLKECRYWECEVYFNHLIKKVKEHNFCGNAGQLEASLIQLAEQGLKAINYLQRTRFIAALLIIQSQRRKTLFTVIRYCGEIQKIAKEYRGKTFIQK